MELERKVLLYLIIVFTFSLSQIEAFTSKNSYIVYFGGHTYDREATIQDYQQATNTHYDFLASFLGSKEKAQNAIFYSYTKHINGFAAFLEEDEIAQISNDPSVISIFPNKEFKLHTTRTWELMQLEKDGKVLNDSIWAKAQFGKDTIIATLDTGVWPESESFNDRGMEPVPSRWRGTCVNNTKEGVPCNRKLIGATYFDKGYTAGTGSSADKVSGTGSSARDMEGHGTHTLSTAAGGPVAGANFFGNAKGSASGGSPSARAAVYKVCWDSGCFSADILAGFDQAIHDGVDVISVSLGGYANDFMSDPISLGTFHAVAEGISVVCSAGNSGPTEGTVANTAPWITTVAANTLDREFPSYLVLGNGKKIEGRSLESKHLPRNRFYPLITAIDAKAAQADPYGAQVCNLGSFDPKKTRGKIVICLKGDSTNIEKGEAVRKAGGVGVVIVNDEDSGEVLVADPHLLPGTNIGYKDGILLSSYMNSTKSPTGAIAAPITRFDVKPTPVMADFSARGPDIIAPQILKPDITAPGVSILSAFTGATSPTGFNYDTRRVPFNLLSGTSMSCPHVSGITGLLKTLHPDWSPSAIKSAIMTTARTRDNTGHPIRDSSNASATPFAYGSGHVRPNRAAEPGLVYDLTVEDYLNFLCALGYNSTAMATFNKKPYKCPPTPMRMEDLNYPSIAAPNMNGTMTVARTLKNVGCPGTYKVRVESPIDVSVSVRPRVLSFSKVGEEKTYRVTLKSERNTGAGYAFGMIIWSDGRHYVRSPLAVNAVS